jgi:hypothetical protein
VAVAVVGAVGAGIAWHHDATPAMSGMPAIEQGPRGVAADFAGAASPAWVDASNGQIQPGAVVIGQEAAEGSLLFPE